MAKYRIKQTEENAFYVQEKKYFFSTWKYVDMDLKYTWHTRMFSHQYQSLEDALVLVNARKDYLKFAKTQKKERKIKYPIFHRLNNK